MTAAGKSGAVDVDIGPERRLDRDPGIGKFRDPVAHRLAQRDGPVYPALHPTLTVSRHIFD